MARVSVQFVLDDPVIVERLRRLAFAVGDQVGDHRISPASIAKFLVMAAALDNEMAETMLGLSKKHAKVRPLRRVSKAEDGYTFVFAPPAEGEPDEPDEVERRVFAHSPP